MNDTKAEGGRAGGIETQSTRFPLSPRDTTARHGVTPTPPPLLSTNNTFHVAVKSSCGCGKSGGPSLPRWLCLCPSVFVKRKRGKRRGGLGVRKTLGWMEGLICEMHQDKCSAFCTLSFPGSCLRGVMLLEACFRVRVETLFFR